MTRAYTECSRLLEGLVTRPRKEHKTLSANRRGKSSARVGRPGRCFGWLHLGSQYDAPEGQAACACPPRAASKAMGNRCAAARARRTTWSLPRKCVHISMELAVARLLLRLGSTSRALALSDPIVGASSGMGTVSFHRRLKACTRRECAPPPTTAHTARAIVPSRVGDSAPLAWNASRSPSHQPRGAGEPPSVSGGPETTSVSTDWVGSVEPTMLLRAQSRNRCWNRRVR
jgi:hypothetical protein